MVEIKYYKVGIIHVVASAAFACTLLASTLAYSQTVPSVADPGRVRDNQTIAPSIPAAPEALPPKDIIDLNIPTGAEETDIAFSHITFKGVSVYDDETLIALNPDVKRPDSTLADIYELVSRITYKYREDGYVLAKASLPTQNVADGKVVIHVIESYVAEVEVAGEYTSTPLIEEMVAKVEEIRPFNIHALEKRMLLLNDLPGLQARSVLQKPSNDNTPGAVSVLIQFAQEDAAQYATFDNRGSRFLGSYQAGLHANSYDLFAPYQHTTASATVTGELQELFFFSASHGMTLTADGLHARISGSYSRTDSGFSLDPLDLEGSSYSITGALNYPVIRARQKNLNVSAIFDFKHSETDILSSELFNDDLRVLRLGVDGDYVDHWQGSNAIALTISKGLGILGASDDNDLNISRAGASGDFLKAEFDFSRTQYIDEDWTGFVAVNAQFSDSPLLSSEEFGYGGQRFGRAYDSSELTGDDGVAGSVELRYGGLPVWHDLTSQMYGFYDAGKVWNRGSGAVDSSATSAGMGWRFNWDSRVNGDISIAYPLTRAVGAPDSGNGNNPRLFFSLSSSF